METATIPIRAFHSNREEVGDDFWGERTSVIELDPNVLTPEAM